MNVFRMDSRFFFFKIMYKFFSWNHSITMQPGSHRLFQYLSFFRALFNVQRLDQCSLMWLVSQLKCALVLNRAHTLKKSVLKGKLNHSITIYGWNFFWEIIKKAPKIWQKMMKRLVLFALFSDFNATLLLLCAVVSYQ